MTISKNLISSPIEAGPSFVDSQKLPPQLVEALDYVSSRLLRKHLHLTLIVVRDETIPSPLSSPLSSPPPPDPARSPSFSSLSVRLRRPDSPRSTSSLSSRSTTSLSSTTSASANPSPPSKCKLPPIDTKIPPSPSNPYNVSLLHASSLSPKATKHLHSTIAKASKRYALGDGWLSTPITPIATSPTSLSFNQPLSPGPLSPTITMENDLIRRSLQQNDLVFSSEGLTLLSLDHVYTFKLALSTYSRSLTSSPFQRFSPITLSPLSPTFSTSNAELETTEERHNRQEVAKSRALSALRLLTLSQNTRPISRSYLLRAYDHLPISLCALQAINDAYRAHFHVDGIDLPIIAQPKISNTSLLRSISGRERSQSFFEQGKEGQRVDKGPHFRAPVTPGGWDDVTPITRGEWDWVLRERLPETGAVETF